MAYAPLFPCLNTTLAFVHLHYRCLLSCRKVHKPKLTFTSLNTNLNILKTLTYNDNNMHSVTNFIKHGKGNRNKAKVNIIRLYHR